MTEPVDVLVIGGGPAGAATAAHLANQGHAALVVERRRYPRPKSCGDALSPQAIRELSTFGIGPDELERFHRVDSVRFDGYGRSVEVAWPSHPRLPRHGIVAKRDHLDELLANRARAIGATVLEGHEATAPIIERGFLRGAVVQSPAGEREIRARYTVVADGANSRFGRALGTFRERSWPYATAIRNYWASPHHDVRHIEAVVDVVDRDGAPVTGYGWVFPVGDGTVNVGLGVLSTMRDFRSINTTQLLDVLAIRVADRWGIEPAEPLGAPASGRIPLGLSVGPSAGPCHLVVGDAAGAANPLTGAGIEYACLSGRFAAEVIDEALRDNTSTALQRYPMLLNERLAGYYKVGRLLDRAAAKPAVLQRLSRAIVRHRSVAEAAVRVGVDEMRPHRTGLGEAAYGIARTVSRFAPDA
ncbi:MAG TPA: geranylgeranyl reductase family protein [Ilumatobacteraceae bacterium]